MNSSQRINFADFLERFMIGETKTAEWQEFIVAHYQEELLEDIRRQVVRISIKYPSHEVEKWDAYDRAKLRSLVDTLK